MPTTVGRATTYVDLDGMSKSDRTDPGPDTLGCCMVYLDTIEGGLKDRVQLLESVVRLILRHYNPSEEGEGPSEIYCPTLVVRRACSIVIASLSALQSIMGCLLISQVVDAVVTLELSCR